MSMIYTGKKAILRVISGLKNFKRYETSWGMPLVKANPKHAEKDVIYHTEDMKFIYNASDVKKKHIYDLLNSKLLLLVIFTPFCFYWPFMCIRWAWKDPVEFGQ